MRALLALLLLISPAAASELTTVRAAGGATARVAASAAPAFQALIHDLEAAGYRISFMGGWRPGHCATASKHPCGLALDVNQTARNRVTRAFPPGTNAMARRHGLLHGAEWRDADGGHFEVRRKMR